MSRIGLFVWRAESLRDEVVIFDMRRMARNLGGARLNTSSSIFFKSFSWRIIIKKGDGLSVDNVHIVLTSKRTFNHANNTVVWRPEVKNNGRVSKT